MALDFSSILLQEKTAEAIATIIQLKKNIQQKIWVRGKFKVSQLSA